MKVSVIGKGWVGKAMKDLFPDAYVYSRTTGTKKKVNSCNIAFVCIPTPNHKNLEGESLSCESENLETGEKFSYKSQIGEGRLDTSAIEEIISWCECEVIVIRSTVNPGDCDRWSLKYRKQIVMQPEYLGESPAHPLLDTSKTPFLIIGGYINDRKKVIDLYTSVYNANVNIRQVSNYEAEVIKLTENRAIAFKVAQCQELYDVCQKIGLDYYTIRNAVYGDDLRFNLWWTFVYPDKRGFNSKCMPKDIYAWASWSESLGYNPEITRAILERNKKWIK